MYHPCIFFKRRYFALLQNLLLLDSSFQQQAPFVFSFSVCIENHCATEKNLSLHASQPAKHIKRSVRVSLVLICHRISYHVNIFAWDSPNKIDERGIWMLYDLPLQGLFPSQKQQQNIVCCTFEKTNVSIWKNDRACQKRSVLTQQPKAPKSLRGAILEVHSWIT